MAVKIFLCIFSFAMGGLCLIALLFYIDWLDSTKISEQDAIFVAYQRVQKIAHHENIPLRHFRGPIIIDSGNQKKYGHRWHITYKKHGVNPYVISVVVTEEGDLDGLMAGRP